MQHPSSVLFSPFLHFSTLDLIQDKIKRQPLQVGYSLTCVWLNVFPFSAFCELTLKLLRFWPVNIQPASTSPWPMCRDLYISPLSPVSWFPFGCWKRKKSQLFCFSMDSGRKYKMVLTHSVHWQQHWEQIVPAVRKEELLGWKGKAHFVETAMFTQMHAHYLDMWYRSA